jgi:competence protein ComEC
MKPKTLLLPILLLLSLLLSACDVLPYLPTLSPASSRDGLLQVHYIDIGQGDAILIISPEGQAALIDSGEVNSGALEYIQGLGIRRLNLVVATHPDADHIGAMAEIIRTIPTDRVVTNGQLHTTRTFERFIDAIAASRAEYLEVRRGDRLPFGTLSFDVLHPTGPGPEGADLNNGSIVLRLAYGQTSFLFTGDAEKQAEEAMIAAGVTLRSDVLKLSHHGSSSSTSPKFLAAVRPAVAVYSAAEGNRYGHPHVEVIDALNRANIQVYGTDQHGTIIITSDGTGYGLQLGGAPAQSVALTPAPTEPPSFSLTITSVTSPVAPGEMATIEAVTNPGATGTIIVYLLSGPSTAAGLEPQVAGPDGKLTWSWRVGSRTTEGIYRIAVTASNGTVDLTQETTYKVEK